MQTIHVFNAFDESLDLTYEELNQWGVEMFREMKKAGQKADLFQRFQLSDADIPRFLFLAGLYHFVGMHQDDCAMEHALEVIQNGRGVSPLVATLRETQTYEPHEGDEYIVEPNGTPEEFMEHLYSIAPPEAKADWPTADKRIVKNLKDKFEKRRADVVEAFEVIYEHGTSFEKAIQWQEIEVREVKTNDFGDFLKNMLDDLLGGLH